MRNGNFGSNLRAQYGEGNSGPGGSEGCGGWEGEAETELLPVCPGLHCLNSGGWEPRGNWAASGYE